MISSLVTHFLESIPLANTCLCYTNEKNWDRNHFKDAVNKIKNIIYLINIRSSFRVMKPETFLKYFSLFFQINKYKY